MTRDFAKVFVTDVAPESWLTILPVVLMLVSGALLSTIRRRIDLHAPVAIASLVALVLLDGALLYRVATDGPLTMVMGRWLPPFGIAFTVDVLGALLALAAALIALATAVFALTDIDANRRRYGFFPFLLFLLAGVSGAFLTGDIFNLYVWFEVLLISSFGLLVLGGERAQIDGATKYGLLNLVGTTLFLVATGYLYAIFGTLNMADIARKAAGTPQDLPLTTLATLYLAAFAMKAAAFPVNFWLAASYHTPRSSVSALFAGLLTKVGVYALMRVLVMLMPAEGEVLKPVIAVVAILTMLAGGFGALGANDIRRLLGYWVVAGIGVMLAGLALGGDRPLAAATFYMLHSMVVMAGLYLLAGLIQRAAGTSDLSRLGGLYGRMPLLSVSALVLLFAVSGLPPFSGFWPKAMLVGASIQQGQWWIAAAILLSGFLITVAAARVFLFAFWRPAVAAGEDLPAVLPRSALGVVVAISLASFAVGVWPEPIARITQQAAVSLGAPEAYLRSVFPEVSP